MHTWYNWPGKLNYCDPQERCQHVQAEFCARDSGISRWARLACDYLDLTTVVQFMAKRHARRAAGRLEPQLVHLCLKFPQLVYILFTCRVLFYTAHSPLVLIHKQHAVKFARSCWGASGVRGKEEKNVQTSRDTPCIAAGRGSAASRA